MAMNEKFYIRQGRLDDIYGIASIYSDSIQELCKDDYEPEIINHWKASTAPESRLKAIENGSLWVAEIDGEIGGYLVSIPGELIALFIGSTFSGLGMGRALGQLGVEIARGESGGQVKLESTITAAPFYKKLGFNETGRGYFSHGISDIKIPVIKMVLPQESS